MPNDNFEYESRRIYLLRPLKTAIFMSEHRASPGLFKFYYDTRVSQSVLKIGLQPHLHRCLHSPKTVAITRSTATVRLSVPENCHIFFSDIPPPLHATSATRLNRSFSITQYCTVVEIRSRNINQARSSPATFTAPRTTITGSNTSSTTDRVSIARHRRVQPLCRLCQSYLTHDRNTLMGLKCSPVKLLQLFSSTSVLLILVGRSLLVPFALVYIHCISA